MSKKISAVELGTQIRSAEFAPKTIDEKARTVEMIIGTDTPIFMRKAGGYFEVLQMEPGSVRLSRAAGGLPLFTEHFVSVSNQIGVVDNVRIDGNKLIGTATFSSRPEAEQYFQDIKAGIIRNISFGYRVLAYADTTSDSTAEYPTLTATTWEPYEVSIVGVEADINAGIRSENENVRTIEVTETTSAEAVGAEAETNEAARAAPSSTNEESEMTTKIVEKKEAAAEEVTGVEQTRSADVVAAAPADATAEIERYKSIRSLVTSVKLEGADDVASDLFTRGLSIDQARAAVLDIVAEKAKDTSINGSRVEIVRDETETRAEGISEALMHRSNATSELTDKGRNYRGMSLVEIARDSLEAAGVKTRGLATSELAKRALHATTDFPNAISGVAEISLRQGYTQAPQTFLDLVRNVTATNFKPIERVGFGEFGTLPVVPAGASYEYATVGDEKEVYSVVKHGKIFGIDWETIVNDDLDVFTRVPAMWGRSASNTVSDLVWGIFLNNPLMSDGVAVFDAAHANLSAGASLSVASMALAEQLLLEQVGPSGEKLNLNTTHVIVAPARKTQAQQLLGNFTAAKSSDVNPFLGAGIKPIVEARLGTGANTPWFIAAANQIDTIEVAYLDGIQGPVLETRKGFEVDGLEWKARLVVGAKAIDFRPFVKNPGN